MSGATRLWLARLILTVATIIAIGLFGWMIVGLVQLFPWLVLCLVIGGGFLYSIGWAMDVFIEDDKRRNGR